MGGGVVVDRPPLSRFFMKINKLFHWLYACLMLLPIMVFIPSILFYAFNDHAKVPEVVEVQYNYKYQTNDVNSLNDLVVNNVYHLDDFKFNADYTGSDYFELMILSCEYTDYYPDSVEDSLIADYSANNNQWINLSVDDTFLYITFFLNDNTYLAFSYDFDIVGGITFHNCDFVISDTDYLSGALSYFQNVLDDQNVLPSSSEFNVLESVDVIEDDTPSISTVVSRAWNDTWHNELFSWSYNSFLTAPFLYITGLFGVSSNSTINFTFSYWLSISIIWLVFDLVMYVPQLVHRWLDKASLS